ncbi:MAG: T9SS type A sorting domain-containing protein, partial [Bacteroidia bacterium]
NTLCGSSVSNLSDISASNTFTYPQNINYTLYQEASDISLQNTSLEVASFVLRDGGGTNDADLLSTTLTALSFNVTNAGIIRRAALYNGTTELAETIVTGSTISFSGFSLSAPDNGSATLTLRVSYTDLVTDNAQNVFTVSSATAGNSGSGFINANAGGSASSNFYDINRIEVSATKLVFTTEPSGSATIYKLISTTPIVTAKDDFGNTDEDFAAEITLGNTVNLAMENTSANMVSGAANFPLLLFTQAGSAILTANATGLQSATSLITILINDAKKWDGEAGTNLWNDAANWSDNTVPAATDVVILDNTFYTNAYNVVLPDVSATVSYLKISAAENNIITLTLPATNIACPGFTIGDNSSGTEDFVIENGGIFINATGCSLSQGFVINAQGSNKAIRINAGGKYIHRNSKSHTEFLDAAAWDENSEMVFDVNAGTSYVISLSNRIFGKLTLSAASKNATQAYSSNYSGLATIMGNLTVETKATLSLSGNGHLNVGGNIVNNGTFSTGNTSRKLVMNGTQAQAFSGTGTYTIKALEINNASGVTLNVPISLSNTIGSGLTLTNGNLNTSATNTLTLQEYSTIAGGSKNSFVAGPLIKNFSTNSQLNIVLPLGKDTLYRPVTITPESIATASTFKAEYFKGTAAYNLSSVDSSLENVSDNEYWNIQRTTGSTNAVLGFNWGESSNITDVENLRIARWDNTKWQNEGGEQSVTGTMNYGSVSTNNLSQFGTFTFGYQKTVPLPVSWLYFTAKAQDKNALLQWATASEINNNGFEIERSQDGENFEVIGWVNGNGTSNQKHFYSYADMEFGSLHTSTVYYRLKQTDFNGAYEYSTIETLRKNEVRLTDISIYTDAQKCLKVQIISSINASTQVEILNMNGQILKQLNTYISAGNNTVKVPVHEMKAGLYVVRVLQNGTLHTEKIVL